MLVCVKKKLQAFRKTKSLFHVFGLLVWLGFKSILTTLHCTYTDRFTTKLLRKSYGASLLSNQLLESHLLVGQ